MSDLVCDEAPTRVRPLTGPPEVPLLELLARASRVAEGILKSPTVVRARAELVENEVVVELVVPVATALTLISGAVGSVLLCVLCLR